MGKNLKGKTAFIVAILVVFCYGFLGIPRGLTPAALKQALTDHINLGLDLKGGTHLILVVHVEEAVGDTTDRDVQRLQDDLEKAGVTGETVHKLDPAHPETITVSGIPVGKASDARSVMDGNDYSNTYDVVSNSDGSEKLTMKPGAIRSLETATLEHSIETIRARLSPLGVTEPTVQQYGLGDNEVLVELPNISDPGKVEDAIKSQSKLAVYAVVSGPYENDQAAMTALNGIVPPDDQLLHGNISPNSPDEVYLLERASVVEGTDFRDAQPSTDQNGRPNLTFTLTTEAGDRFYKYTSAHSKDSANAGLDGDRSGQPGAKRSPAIESAIRDRGEIHGSFTKDEVDNLSLMLRTGALPASIDTLETTTVGPSLGAASIRQGIIAAVAGMMAVLAFMLIYYRGAGINADLALFLNLVILLGFMGYTNSTLTLPGIAGVILTIGMGVDSNVLIFERIREELRAGKTAAVAVQQGFGHAWITIVDTHVTTIVSAAILFLFGTGPVQGFAVTLTFGLLANLFTAVFVSRTIFDAILASKERGAALSI